MKKRISLLLAVFMLFNIFAPGFSDPAYAVQENNFTLYAEPTGKNAAEHITITNLTLENMNGNTQIDPNKSGGLNMSFNFELANGKVHEGDYFEIQLSPNMNFFGDSTSASVPNFYNSAGALIATGTYDEENHKFIYAFTDYVDNSMNIQGRGQFPLWVDRQNVTHAGEETFNVRVAGEETSTTLEVVFTCSEKLVDSFITESDPFGTTFEQTVYVNPKHENLSNTVLSIRADNWEGKTGSIATINPQYTTFVGYRVPKGSQVDFPLSFGVDTSRYEKVELVPKFDKAEDGVDYVEFNFGNYTSDGTGFIVVMSSKTTGKQGPLRVSAHVQTSNQEDYYWNNENIVELSSTDIEGENLYQLGDYVWEDANKDGVQDPDEHGVAGVEVTLTKPDGTQEVTSTDQTGFYIFSDLPNGNYKVEFATPQGYEATITKAGEDERFDSNGVASTVSIQDANDYTIDYGIVKVDAEKGVFQEHHQYREVTKDFDGNVINEKITDTVTGAESQGTSADTYITKEQPKAGYQLVNVKGENGATFASDGSEAEGHYVANEKQEVFYEYEKVIQPGRFQDTHRYFIEKVNQAGEVIETVEVAEMKYSNEVQEGFRGESTFSASTDAKDGFVYRHTSDHHLADENDITEATGEILGDYVGGQLQTITYNYYKQEVVEEPIDGNTEDPGDGNTEEPNDGNTEEPGDGNTEEPNDGNTEDPGEGDTEEPSDGNTEEPGDGNTEKPDDGEIDQPHDDSKDPDNNNESKPKKKRRGKHTEPIQVGKVNKTETPEPTPVKQPEPKQEQEPEPTPEIKSDDQADVKPESKSDKKPEAKPEVQHEPQPTKAHRAEPVKEKQPNKRLPKTGGGVVPTALAGAMALAGGALTLFGLQKRKEDEDEE